MEERVGYPVGQDVDARVELQRGLHDDARAPLAHAEQVVDQQQRVARAGVAAEHDQRAVAVRDAGRRAGHRHAQPAGAARGPVDQVEEPRHDRVVAGLVRLGVQPPAEPAHEPQAEGDGQRGGLPRRPDQPEPRDPQQPRPAHAPGAGPPAYQVEGRGEQGDRRGQRGQGAGDHHDERHQQQAADRRGRQHGGSRGGQRGRASPTWAR